MPRKPPSARNATAFGAWLVRALPEPRSETRREVLAHALHLFNERGIEATKIEDLRRASGQSIGSIYHHFGNKEGVAAALFFAAFDDLSAAIAARLDGATGSRACIAALVTAYAEWVSLLPEPAHYLFLARETVARGPQGPALEARLEARYRPIDERLAEDARLGVLRELPEDLIPALVLGSTESYCRGWLVGRRRASPAAHAPLLAEAAWRAIASDR
jgi:AcrR family transcriptional regulator